MSSPPLHKPFLLASLALVLTLAAAGCGASSAPQLKVLGVERAHRADSVVLLVEVVNHAARPMQLERLQYTFGPARSVSPSAGTGSSGDVSLDRTVEAGAAVVVQVPLDLDGQGVTPGQQLVLSGQLVAHENQIERRFPVNAALTAPAAADGADREDAPAPAPAAPPSPAPAP